MANPREREQMTLMPGKEYQLVDRNVIKFGDARCTLIKRVVQVPSQNLDKRSDVDEPETQIWNPSDFKTLEPTIRMEDFSRELPPTMIGDPDDIIAPETPPPFIPLSNGSTKQPSQDQVATLSLHMKESPAIQKTKTTSSSPDPVKTILPEHIDSDTSFEIKHDEKQHNIDDVVNDLIKSDEESTPIPHEQTPSHVPKSSSDDTGEKSGSQGGQWNSMFNSSDSPVRPTDPPEGTFKIYEQKSSSEIPQALHDTDFTEHEISQMDPIIGGPGRNVVIGATFCDAFAALGDDPEKSETPNNPEVVSQKETQEKETQSKNIFMDDEDLTPPPSPSPIQHVAPSLVTPVSSTVEKQEFTSSKQTFDEEKEVSPVDAPIEVIVEEKVDESPQLVDLPENKDFSSMLTPVESQPRKSQTIHEEIIDLEEPYEPVVQIVKPSVENIITEQIPTLGPSTRKRERNETLSPVKKVMTGKPKILFTGIEVVDKEKAAKWIQKLGGEVVEEPKLATHLVTKKLHRTEKFLTCMTHPNVWIVTFDWIEESQKKKRWLDEIDFILTKSEKEEQQYSINLEAALRLRVEMDRNGQKVFSFLKFLVTGGHTAPSKAVLENLITSGGGIALSKEDTDCIVITCDADLKTVKKMKKTQKFYVPDLVLNGILGQKLDFGKYKFNT